MKDKNDLVEDITGYLDASIEALDPEILSQIRVARYNALDQKQPGSMRWFLSMSGIAVSFIVLFIAIYLFTGSGDRSKPRLAEIQPDQIELIEILSSDQPLDFFENLEFYAWIAENEDI